MNAVALSYMAAIRTFVSKSLSSTSRYTKIWNHTDPIRVGPAIILLNRDYHSKESGIIKNHLRNGFGMKNVEYLGNIQFIGGTFAGAFSPKFSNRFVLPISISSGLSYKSYSSSIGGRDDKTSETIVSAASNSGVPSGSESDVGGSDWADTAKDVWKSILDGITYTGEKAKETSTELAPYVERFLDSHPYLRDVIAPISVTLAATVLAWMVMPRILRRFHKYSTEGPAALLSGTTLWGPVLYEKSFWGALEVPLRYTVTFMAFSQIAMMVAPTTIAAQYIQPAWRGAIIIAFVWFLHRWKTNVFSRALAGTSITRVERDRLLTFDKFSSVGLFALGSMALAEACGVAVQSILTVGGIGGVATAFAARDILGNVLSGLSVQMSQPFSIGDTIKAGSVEGQVTEMGLTTTSLLSAEKFPIIVPNSLFSSQVIVNKSRAGWRAMATKIPIQIDDTNKIPLISEDIKSMLRSNEKVFLEKEQPYCFLSRVDRMCSELTLGCNLKKMSKDEMFATEQDILLQSVKIIKEHGADLGSNTSQ